MGGSTQSGEGRIVDTFLSRLTAFPVAKTRVLQIEFVSQDPELAARGANVVAQLFLEGQEDAKKNAAKAASAWLASKIDELRTKVADADAKVENYRAQSGLLVGRQQYDRSDAAARGFEHSARDGALRAIGGDDKGAAHALAAEGRQAHRRARPCEG